MVRLCGRCARNVLGGTMRCACGGEVVEYVRPDEIPDKGEEKNKGPYGASKLGARLGSLLTEGSPVGEAIGYAVGRVVEELAGKEVVTFHKVPPLRSGPDIGKIVIRALVNQGKKAAKAVKRSPKDKGERRVKKS